MMPDKGAAIAFKPGMNLATSSTRGPLRVKLTWDLRTQESGSSEIRQSNCRTRTPFRRPSSCHIESLATAPMVAKAMAIPRFIWCVPESAPAARSSGAEGTGRPACSTKTHANTSMYPCRTTNWSNSVISWLSGRTCDRRWVSPCSEKTKVSSGLRWRWAVSRCRSFSVSESKFPG